MYSVLLQQKSDIVSHVPNELTLNHTNKLQEGHDSEQRPLIQQCSISEWMDPPMASPTPVAVQDFVLDMTRRRALPCYTFAL